MHFESNQNELPQRPARENVDRPDLADRPDSATGDSAAGDSAERDRTDRAERLGADPRLHQVRYLRSLPSRRSDGRLTVVDLAHGQSGLGRTRRRGGAQPLKYSHRVRSGSNDSNRNHSSSKHSASNPSGSNQPGRVHPDPMTQSLVLLATMALVLVAARFAVPYIVEEIRYAWHRGELRAEYETGVEGIRSVSLEALSDASQMVSSIVGPSVVHIDVQRRVGLKDFSGTEMLSRELPSSDQGSGVLVTKDGYILTNRHVISGGQDITVKLSDGRRVAATVVGTDELTDLAVLKVDADHLISIGWGDSDRCKVGSPVWAVGSPFGLDRTVTFGILSGKHRMVRASTQYQDFMQSDVAVNPGNSGGPLVDAKGTLIGINTAIVGDTYQGVSFSIPSNVARRVYESIRSTGQVERAWLGVQLADVDQGRPETTASASPPSLGQSSFGEPLTGAYVAAVTGDDSPAALAGLRAGDRIVSIDGTEARDIGHLMRMIGGSMAGSVVILGVDRNGQSMEIEVKLGSRPAAFN